jgi:hypothetical protein
MYLEVSVILFITCKAVGPTSLASSGYRGLLQKFSFLPFKEEEKRKQRKRKEDGKRKKERKKERKTESNPGIRTFFPGNSAAPSIP